MKAYRNIQNPIFTLFIPFVLFMAIACSKTDLNGQIILEKKKIAVGDTIEMQLEVPPELDKMYGIMWTVKPDGVGKVIYKDLGPAGKNATTSEGDVRKEDRKALFLANKPGACTIFVHAFYDKNIYQPVTELRVFIDRASKNTRKERGTATNQNPSDELRITF